MLTFYALRDVAPQRTYPLGADRRLHAFNDLPAAVRNNIDRVDPPLHLQLGQTAALSARDQRDTVALLRTLDDGWPGAR